MLRKPLELYLHIPFCERKCGYCDFLSAAAPADVRRRYVGQLMEEIAGRGARCSGYVVTSVFFGGGTPSVLEPGEMLALMRRVRVHFRLAADAEVTMEVNPGTVTPQKLQAFREGGVNRVSIGLQSADDGELEKLGRIHTYDEFLNTYQRVRQAGFANVNVDLMSALPGQTLASWKETLKCAAMLKPEHISAYSLMIEVGTPFYERYHGHPELLPDEEEEREMYDLTRRFLGGHGYERYEISNYAKPGRECRHNVGYWTGAEYLGLGLGASSYIRGCRFRNEEDLGTYCGLDMRGADADRRLRREVHRLTREEKMEEFMFLGLRMMRGVSGREFERRFGAGLWEVYGGVLDKLLKNGLAAWEEPWLRLSDFGIDVSNYVLSEFLLTDV